MPGDSGTTDRPEQEPDGEQGMWWVTLRIRQLIDSDPLVHDGKVPKQVFVRLANACNSTPDYIRMLYNGQRDSPGVKIINGIADEFGVLPGRLVDRPRGSRDASEYLPTLADRVDSLFHGIPQEDGRPFTSADVARRIAEAPEDEDEVQQLTTQIDRIRSGEDTNPGVELLGKVATVFEFDLTYLVTQDLEVARRQREQLAKLEVFVGNPLYATFRQLLDAPPEGQQAALRSFAPLVEYIASREQSAAETGPRSEKEGG
jgi:transcriptional regulator with XRE-family HTH domain